MIPKLRVFVKAGTKPFFSGHVYDEDQMIYDVISIDVYHKEISVWGCNKKYYGIGVVTYGMKDVKIMMSTEIEDRNGVEIYEGDIVKCFDEIAIVKKAKGSFTVVTIDGYRYASIFNGHMKVLGNIYENPELLETELYSNESEVHE